MDPIVIAGASLAFDFLIGVMAYLMKRAYEDLKDENDQLWREVNHVKEKYFKKEDFTDFKSELWKRFDRLEDDMKARIEELKK